MRGSICYVEPQGCYPKPRGYAKSNSAPKLSCGTLFRVSPVVSLSSHNLGGRIPTEPQCTLNLVNFGISDHPNLSPATMD